MSHKICIFSFGTSHLVISGQVGSGTAHNVLLITAHTSGNSLKKPITFFKKVTNLRNINIIKVRTGNQGTLEPHWVRASSIS